MKLAILSHTLEREIYGDTAFVDAVQKLATQHGKSQIRVLIHSPEWASRSGHRLVELGRRLTTFIEFRELHEQHKDVANELLIADENAVLLRDSPDTTEAQYHPAHPALARQWLRRYDEWWTMAQAVPGLRRLNT